MTLETMRLAVLARRMVPSDPPTADAWYRLIEAIDAGWIDLPRLEFFAAELEAGFGHGVEEFGLEVEGDEVVVTFVKDEERCGRASLADALRALARAARGEGAPGDSSSAAWRAGEAVGRSVADGPSPRVDDILGAQPAPGDAPPELQSAVSVAREVARRLRDGEPLDGLDLPAAPRLTPAQADHLAALAGRVELAAREALAQDPEALTKAAGALGRWMQGDSAAGRELDALVARLDAATATADSTTDPMAAVRERARGSIAASIRRSGFDPNRRG